MAINFLKAKTRLFKVWGFFSLALISFFLIQTITGRYKFIEKKAWEWFLPNILPCLTIIFSSLFFDNNKKATIQKSYFLLCLYASLSYLLFLAIILISYSRNSGNIIDYYNRFDILLKSLLPLITGILGLFFIKRE